MTQPHRHNKQAWPDAVVTWGLRLVIVFYVGTLVVSALLWVGCMSSTKTLPPLTTPICICVDGHVADCPVCKHSEE